MQYIDVFFDYAKIDNVCHPPVYNFRDAGRQSAGKVDGQPSGDDEHAEKQPKADHQQRTQFKVFHFVAPFVLLCAGDKRRVRKLFVTLRGAIE
jgi:hypothetical protein